LSADSLDNGLDDEKNKGKLKALVRPQVLTHVIEGFVVQEGQSLQRHVCEHQRGSKTEKSINELQK
jgi:hypothetical protein